MLHETRGYVKFAELDAYAKVNCMDQFINIMCPYEDFSGDTMEELEECIEYWLAETPAQYWIDLEGNWYDEGRMVV